MTSSPAHCKYPPLRSHDCEGCSGLERLEVDGDRPALGLTHSGYLFMASESGLDVLRENHAVQRAAGADVALLSPGEISARFP